jgi:hypothetical protein
MDEKTIQVLAKAICALPYAAWVKLRTATDRAFDAKRSEIERSLYLTSSDDIMKFIRSQFG